MPLIFAMNLFSPRTSMKRLLISSLSAVVSISMVSPAFAYITKNENIEVQTSTYHDGRPAKRLIMDRFGETYNRPTVGERRTHYSSTEREVAPVTTNRTILENAGGVYSRVRTTAVDDTTGRAELERHTLGRRLRRLNRMPKADSDRYRVLDLRPNTRSLRMQVESTDESSYLPSSLVQTGGDTYDKPTRRDIRENRLTNVNDRDRNVLAEIKNSARNN